MLLNKSSRDYAGPTIREVWDTHPPLSEFVVEPRAITRLFVSGGDVTNNKPALLVFYGLIIASVTVWVSLAVTML